MNSFSETTGRSAAGPRLAAFDLDGTLVDSAPDLHAAANALMREHGLGAFDLGTVTGFVGAGIPTLVARCFAHHGAPPSDPQAATQRFRTLYAMGGHALTAPYGGVIEALDALAAQGWRLAVCTNKDEAAARTLLMRLGLAARFQAVIGGDSLLRRKPDPSMLRAAAQASGARIEQAVMIGDSETDAALARNAGAPFVLFTRGYRKQTVEQIAPDARFDDFRELPALLRGLG